MAQIIILSRCVARLTNRNSVMPTLNRLHSTTTSTLKDGAEESTYEKKTSSILDLSNASKHCEEHVKKFDNYAFRVGSHMPKSM